MKLEKENECFVYDLRYYLKEGCACVPMASGLSG